MLNKDNRFYIIKDLLIKIKNKKEIEKLTKDLRVINERKAKFNVIMDDYYKVKR
jgi:hypothetical protein